MKKNSIPLIIFVCLCLFSCHNGEQDNVGKMHIDFFSESEDFDRLDILDRNVFIPLLENEDKEYFLKQIDKVVLKNCTIYIADTYMQNLFLYDMEGHQLGRVGKKGEGPDEYLSLSDFCIADDGKIYWYDGIKNRVQVYDKDLSLLKQHEVLFKAECIQCTKDGFLFSLAPYNADENTQKKCLLYTDAQFNPVKTALQYSDDIDPNVEFYSPLLSFRDGVLYNRVIDNNVYVLNENGIKQCYYFDFGSKNIESEYLKDLNKLMESGEKYCYLAVPPILLDHYFIGCLNKDGEICTFVYDLESQKSYVKKMLDFNLKSLNLPVSLSDDDRIVSYMNKEIYPEFENDITLTDEIRKTMDEDGFVLCLSKLK